VFDFVREDCELKLDLIDEDSSSNMGDGYKKLGEILLERGDLTREAMQEILSKQKRFGELAIESGIVAHESIESALKEQERVKTQRKSRQLHESVTSMRVSASKLDMLVNLVGELVTVQARLTETAIKRDNAEFIAIAEEVERLTANLRDNTLNIRMLPIGSTFSKFRRLVRDLSGELGKKIEMTNHGAETELDKTIIEQLNDPLIHIIRNCIDHGIEMPEERKEAGKPRHGTIHISALHSGDNVVISIKDDGRGLDKEAITAKAIKKGLVSPTAKLTDDEIYAQVFTSGFSTAKQVTSISGRGVGMNVVKRAIEDLRGSISIKSTPKVGTTITIKIPLTLAIIESLLVRIGDDNFVMPLSVVNDVVEMTPEALAETHGRNLAKVRGSIIPYIPLGERFGIRCTPPDDIPQVVIVNVEGQLIGVMVDQVIGEHHTVIKSLGSFYKNVHGVSGATIMGDGSVALILDIPQLMHNFEEELETIQESERQAGVGLNVGRYRNVIKTSDQSNVEFEGGIS
jgi:two-component system chemotaxis sensor kinase CheA